jgi:hypothetical protein
MSGPELRSGSGRQGTRAVCLVLTLALLVLGLTFAASRHTHARASLGWYNAECPLAELTARAELGSVLSSSPSVSTGLIAGQTLHLATPSIPAPAVVVAAARAPPLA